MIKVRAFELAGHHCNSCEADKQLFSVSITPNRYADELGPSWMVRVVWLCRECLASLGSQAVIAVAESEKGAEG